MTEIAIETGLPELPEGHYWRLQRHGVSIRRNLPDTQWARPFSDYSFFSDALGDALLGEAYKTEEKTVVEDVKTVRKRFLWGDETVVEKREVKYARRVNRSIEVVSVPTAYSGETETVSGTGSYTGTWHPVYGYYGPRYELTPTKDVKLREILTRENVLDLCNKALKELDGLSLQGDYPPKVFNAAAGE